MKNFSQACENNKKPILEILKVVLRDCSDVLEVGSGSGQHAVYFGEYLSHLKWQTTELSTAIGILEDNLSINLPKNVLMPIELDVTQHPWPIESASSIFSANTLHILAWRDVEQFFKGSGAILKQNGLLCVYGPFRYQGNYTSASNADFDSWLKARNFESGIRDFEDINSLAQEQGLELQNDYSTPANNQLLIWQRLN
jgi:cyclopropane fatty-acyl-phospholipid synthase-like methyltransferase